jgi:phosphatidylinositol alpha-1,6-mannosyltransferase
MKIAIATEQRFFRDRAGAIHTDNAIGSYEYWKTYGEVFESVLVLARVSRHPGLLSARAEGPGVKIYPLSDYLGIGQYVQTRVTLKKEIAIACDNSHALIARLPGAIGDLAIREYERTSKAYAVYVVGDPAGLLSRDVVRHPLQPLIKWHSTRDLKRWCRKADCVAYVTRNYLQQLYPSSSQYVTSYSDVDLPREAFITEPRSATSTIPLRIICVAMLSQRYKGIGFLLEALPILDREGVRYHLEVVGDGALRPTLERKASMLGIGGSVSFTGLLPDASAVRERLDAADIFVLPSLTEGLPRALLEAMARGLPCVASSVGGVVELLHPSDLVPPREPLALANKILEVSRDEQRLVQMSTRNRETAAEYSGDVTGERRMQFCRQLAELASIQEHRVQNRKL